MTKKRLTLRPEVRAFAELMELKLQKNDYKRDLEDERCYGEVCHICVGEGHILDEDERFPMDGSTRVCPLCRGSGDRLTREEVLRRAEEEERLVAEVDTLEYELEELGRHNDLLRAALLERDGLRRYDEAEAVEWLRLLMEREEMKRAVMCDRNVYHLITFDENPEFDITAVGLKFTKEKP